MHVRQQPGGHGKGLDLVSDEVNAANVAPWQREQDLSAIVTPHEASGRPHDTSVRRRAYQRIVFSAQRKATHFGYAKKSEHISRLEGGNFIRIADQYHVAPDRASRHCCGQGNLGKLAHPKQADWGEKIKYHEGSARIGDTNLEKKGEEREQ